MSVSTFDAAEIDAQPISFYIDLYPNTKADLEVIAEASLAFVRALRAAAYEVSPEHELKVEFVSGTEGSLSINSILRFISSKTGFTPLQLATLAVTTTTFTAAGFANWGLGKGADAILEMITGPKAQEISTMNGLSPETIQEIAVAVGKVLRAPEVQKQVSQIYKTLDKDVSVRGIGIRLDDLRIPPEHIVLRSEFKERVLDARELQAVESHRNREVLETVKLVTAVLDPKSRRKWVIETSEGVRSATMSDKAFVSRLESGKITTRLSAQMQLEADLVFTETKTRGNWKTTGVSITRVRRIILPNSAESLLSALAQ